MIGRISVFGLQGQCESESLPSGKGLADSLDDFAVSTAVLVLTHHDAALGHAAVEVASGHGRPIHSIGRWRVLPPILPPMVKVVRLRTVEATC